MRPISIGEGKKQSLWKHLSSRRVLKTVKLTAIRNGPKWIISTSGRLG